MVLLIPIPLLISYVISRYIPKLKNKIKGHMSLLNAIFLSLLIFVLFGVSSRAINFNYINYIDLIHLVIIALFQDFGVFILISILLKKHFQRKKLNAIKVTLSIKNVALASSILLFYDPKAALAPSICFISHAIIFNFIPVFKKKMK